MKNYTNPILTGFHADPSICRVGEDYYLAVSSFLYFPGIPIYHSRDLVHWEQIGNAVSWENPLDLRGMKETGGIWAPTLRFHDGLFYLTAAMEGYGNFILHAERPQGPWSQPVWVPVGGVDPDLFWENGKLYYSTNERCGCREETISTCVVDPSTGRLTEPPRPIWHGTGGPHLEAPHLYHIGDWYYLTAAEGGTSLNHMVTAARSRSIYGPYESCPFNPILTNRDDAEHAIYGTGHADLVQDAQGNWWMVCLGTRTARRTMSHLGRETFLMPVQWEDGWFRCGCVHMKENGELPDNCDFASEQNCPADSFEDFAWPPYWHFPGNREMTASPGRNIADANDSAVSGNAIARRYIRGGGCLRINPETDTAMVLTPQSDFDCDICVTIDCNAADGGLILYHTQEFYYRFGLRAASDGGAKLYAELHGEDLAVTVASVKLTAATIPARMRLHIRAGKERYHFLYAPAGIAANPAAPEQELASLTTRYLADAVIGRSFTGTMAGLYAEGDATAVFRDFRITKRND